jgi:hypothetical protein
MRKFIERQGESGRRDLTIARNRFAGDNNGRGRGESRHMRAVVAERDERRLFSVQSMLDDAIVGGDSGSTSVSDSKGARCCSTTGFNIPAGGGKVRLDDVGTGRRPTLYFSPSGSLVAAHF